MIRPVRRATNCSNAAPYDDRAGKQDLLWLAAHVDRLALRQRSHVADQRIQLVAAIGRRLAMDRIGDTAPDLIRQLDHLMLPGVIAREDGRRIVEAGNCLAVGQLAGGGAAGQVA